MKRLLPLILIILLLVGCELESPLDTEYEEFDDTYTPWGTFAYTVPANTAELPRQNGTVKTVRSYSGEIPLTDPIRSYSYELPMIDLSGSHALGCNQDIEDFFGILIEQSLDAMGQFEDPILERLSYSSFTVSGILTLRVDRVDFDGTTNQAWYTVDAETGEAVSVERLFAAADISGTPKDVLDKAVLNRFTSKYGALEGSDAAHTTAYNRTQGALSPLTANRMHLNENGSLTVAVELFAPEGGSNIIELVLP